LGTWWYVHGTRREAAMAMASSPPIAPSEGPARMRPRELVGVTEASEDLS